MILQLSPSIPVSVTGTDLFPNGSGECVGWIDYSKEDDLIWIVFMDSTGESWLVPNKYIRAIRNISIGRNN